MRNSPPDQRVLDDVKRSALAENIKSNESHWSVLSGVGDYVTKGRTIDEFRAYEQSIRAVTVDDIKRVIATYLDDSQVFTGRMVPKV